MFRLECIYRPHLSGTDPGDADWTPIGRLYPDRRQAEAYADLLTLDDALYAYRVIELKEEPA